MTFRASLISLNPAQFKGLISLKELSLGSNQLSTLPKNIFSGLTWLNSLDLSNNGLTQIMSDTFKGLSSKNLLELDLSGNKISLLSVSALSFSNLCEINLRSNQIKLSSLTGQSFGDLKNMCSTYTIYLKGNPILDELKSKNVDMQTLCNSNRYCFISNT